MPRLAPMPPLPADPAICRWCATRRIAVGDRLICPAGCSANDVALRHARCECGAEFTTGKPFEVLCWPCASRETAELTAGYAADVAPAAGSYVVDARQRATTRHALAADQKGTVA